MKKLFLLTITAGLAASSYAQNTNVTPLGSNVTKSTMPRNFMVSQPSNLANRTTSVIHDSILLDNLDVNDTTLYTYPINQVSGSTDSGTAFGQSVLGFDGFAERYDFKSPDSSIQVLGIFTVFGGKANPATTNFTTFKVWSQSGVTATSRPTLKFNGFPNALLDSVNVLNNDLEIDNTGALSAKIVWFPTPTAYLTDSFYVGCTMNYDWATGAGLNGDTVHVLMSESRVSPKWTIIGTDTMVNNQSAIRNSSGTWLDLGFNLGVSADYYFFPIVNSKVETVGFQGITTKGFTFFGAYPNPAVNSTNVKFALAAATDVTIQVVDMSGRTVSTVNHSNLSAGEHVINMETSNFAAGEYVCVIRAENGGGIATKITVAK